MAKEAPKKENDEKDEDDDFGEFGQFGDDSDDDEKDAAGGNKDVDVEKIDQELNDFLDEDDDSSIPESS